MTETTINGQSIQIVSDTLSSLLAPYEQKVEYGRIRKTGDFGDEFADEILWRFTYQNKYNGGRFIMFRFDKKQNMFIISGGPPLNGTNQQFVTSVNEDAYENLEDRMAG